MCIYVNRVYIVYTYDMSSIYKEEYTKLNPLQREAVDTIEGPVMVIAGPGTGKTQVLALRIAHILEETDTPAHGILCLTFTRAGVKAMRERLTRYMGLRAREVVVSTFHSFAISLIEKHYAVLDFERPPTLLDEKDAIFLIDELLHAHDWNYIRPRSGASSNFRDIKSLMSLLKRERITADMFRAEIYKEITKLEEDPSSISSRGETKGSLKKDVQKRIDSLKRTEEVVTFYEEYEMLKKERLVMDHDDCLEYLVQLVEQSENVQAELRENYLYVLVDEHQDSSGVQNNFLKAVWSDVEDPNLFVVGDDRQLIYGFGGASLSNFEEFKTTFANTKLITLIDNYRSTKPILSLADELLKSTLTTDTLRSNTEGDTQVVLSEYAYPRDEIIAAGLHFKKLIEQGVPAEECAILVPKRKNIKVAVSVLRNLGIPVKSQDGASFFDAPETEMLLRTLSVVSNPHNKVVLAETMLNHISGIPPLSAHAFLYTNGRKDISVTDLLEYQNSGGLFDEQNPIRVWGEKIQTWIEKTQSQNVLESVHTIASDLLITTAQSHEELVTRTEVVRTILHLASLRMESHPKETIQGFLEYIQRLEEYGHTVPLATLLGGKGVNVMTLHGSKGLEYTSVWIAHMNESTLMSQMRFGFTVPEVINQFIESRDETVARREVYVAVTRAKEECTISYARHGYNGNEIEVAGIIEEIPEEFVDKRNYVENEDTLVKENLNAYGEKVQIDSIDTKEELLSLVRDTYSEKRVSVTVLNNFFDCPWKWYFRNLLQVPEIKGPSLSFGSAVHKALELLLNDRTMSVEKIEEVIVYALHKEGVYEGSVYQTMKKDALETVLLWKKMYLQDISSSYETEYALSYKDKQFPELVINGKIDLVERYPDGTVSVTDFKTGKSQTTGVISKMDEEGRLSSYMRQLAMYSYLIQNTHLDTKVISSKLLFLEAKEDDKNRLYSIRITEEHIDALRNDIATYDKELTSGEWISRKCYTKTYGGDDECEYCKKAKMLYGIS